MQTDRGDKGKRQAFTNQFDRDHELEKRYAYDRTALGGDSAWDSTLAYVADHQARLTTEYWSWRGEASLSRSGPLDDLHESLRGFELLTFDHELDAAAHGVLAFAVRRSIEPGEPGARYVKRPSFRPPWRPPSKELKPVGATSLGEATRAAALPYKDEDAKGSPSWAKPETPPKKPEGIPDV